MRSRRRLESAALILPLLGAAIIVPPIIGVFNAPRLVFGVPLVAVYLFAIWAALIALTAVLGQSLCAPPRERESADVEQS